MRLLAFSFSISKTHIPFLFVKKDALDRTTPKGFFMRTSRGIAKGMAYLHSRGIIHRDIKPGNVLLNGDVASGNFEVKVTDFGVSTEYSTQSKDRTAETGTYRWMAPEVIRHENYSSPADVYSFAIVLWQLLTREHPFADKSTFEAAATVAMEKGRPPFPDGTPPSIQELIESCWAHNPEDRPQFDDIIASLNNIEASSLSDDELSWLDAPLGHKVYAKPVTVHTTKRVHLQVPVRAVQRRKSEIKRFGGLFARKSSDF
jgi:serine/threonine protein kinase